MKIQDDDAVPVGTACNAAIERSLDQSEADRPGLAGRLPYGYRLMQSPFEQAVIPAMRHARGCGKSGRWIASTLNSRGILHRGKAWTARAVSRVLGGEPRGAEGDGHLQAIFDDLKKFAEFLE